MTTARFGRYSRIPAGQYAGQYRGRLTPKGGRQTNQHGAYGMKHVVCGVCRTPYDAWRYTCPDCEGVA